MTVDQPMLPLMLLGRALTPDERRAFSKGPRKTGHAALPGTGPAGETCGSCVYLVHKKMAKAYLKCELRRATWTGGGGTDVRARDAACSKWLGGEQAWAEEQKRRQASLEESQ
jgi:hypothetical protein